jgi:UrcA family protein
MNSNIKTTLTAAIMLTSVIMVGSVFAADAVPSEVVKFPELNLNSPAGVATLYKRIHSAALRVCSAGSTDALSRQHAYKECAQDAETRAVSKVNAPALTAYYQQKTGRLVATLAGN